MGCYVQTEENVSLFVEDIGQGQPIVFLHGWPLCHNMFEYQMNELPKKGFRCIGIDFRGYGQSDKPFEGYDYDTMADDVKAVIYTLELKDAVLAGFSMGGAIAVRYMTRHGGADIKKLILMSAAAPSFTKRPDYPYGFRKKDVDDLIAGFQKDRPKALADFSRIFFAKSKTPEFKQWFQNLGLSASSYGTLHSAAALRDEDLRKELKDIKVPTLIMHGVKDKVCSVHFAKELKRRIPSASFIPFEESGHGIFYEEKDRLNEEITRFAKE
ncbi:alpha/beta fold hydrolase [Bacillus nakamurai]|uniref:alpha/beta fold hydrolase n=1 Tax=Bacillus nakamurai TaxID=1793963 RepID=UPI0020C43AFC|nr:alpha/beta hydrolase [Bacillus nakamurai]MCP6683499.1 alpha/beta hydrolase [Bacillus nakamurai]